MMRDCGFGGDARRGTLLTGSVCEGAPAAQHDFWHSGLNAAIVQEGNEASAEGIGECASPSEINLEGCAVSTHLIRRQWRMHEAGRVARSSHSKQAGVNARSQDGTRSKSGGWSSDYPPFLSMSPERQINIELTITLLKMT